MGGTCAHESKRLHQWTLDIPDLDIDPPTHPLKWPTVSNNTYKILHLSDPHVQLDYSMGASTDCGKAVCCSSSDPPPKDPSRVAGRFGDYHCDLPLPTLKAILQDVKSKHLDVDFIFLTGDYPAHDVWRQDRQHNLAAAKAIVEAVSEHFPGLPVFPAIGNHEAFPVNMFPVNDKEEVPKSYDPSWLYNSLGKVQYIHLSKKAKLHLILFAADLYHHWLPDVNQQRTLRDSGYYSIKIKNDTLRIVSINANFCNNFNFWLLLNFNDPHHHLHWLYRQLHKAELSKEKVYIIGHIAPGLHSCLGRWSHEYNRLVRRFRNTITGQFFGHTHLDEFEVFFNDELNPISVAYLAPSQTPWMDQGLNPAYRIYVIDSETHLPIDHQTYFLDLEQANRVGEAALALEYSARNDLNLADMSPESWYNYVRQLHANDVAYQQFRNHYYRYGPEADISPCEDDCKDQLLCSLLTSEAQLVEPPIQCQFEPKNHVSSWWQSLWE